MTEYERLSLLALAEIIEALQEIRFPTNRSLGIRREEVMRAIRASVAAEKESDFISYNGPRR